MNPFDSIGNFFAGLFGKKKKDQNQSQPQVAVQRPTRPAPVSQGFQLNVPGVPQAPGVQAVNSLTPKPQQKTFDPASLNLGGVKIQAPVQPAQPTAPQPSQQQKQQIASIVAHGNQIDPSVQLSPEQKSVALQRHQDITKTYQPYSVGNTVDAVKNAIVHNPITDSFINHPLDELGKQQQVNQELRKRGIMPGMGPVGAQQTSEYGQKIKQAEQASGQKYDPVKGLVAFTDLASNVDGIGGVKELAKTAGRGILKGGESFIHALDQLRLQGRDPAGIIAEDASKIGADIPNVNPVHPPEVKPSVVGVTEKPREVPIEAPREPGSSITPAATPVRAPAITSPNRPVAAVQSPAPFTAPEAAGVRPPVIEAPRVPEAAPKAATPDQAVADAQKAIDQAATQAPAQPVPSEVLNTESPVAAETRKLAATQPPVSPAVEAEIAREAANKAPTDAIAAEAAAPGKLGTITRQAVLDGSINTPEGAAKAIADTRAAANAEAEAAGAKLPDIIRKGQKVWEKSKADGHDLTTAEALAHDASFTPEQQQIYKNYAQEIGTLRDRSGFSLDGGNQGAWYAPRQSLVDNGVEKVSAEFDPSLVNEIRRNKDQATGGVTADMLDVSHVPHEQAMQRYANAPDAGAQTLVHAVEYGGKNGEKTGIKVPDETKAKLESSLQDLTDKRDEVMRLAHDGNIDQANKLKSEVQRDINKVFNDFIDEIPGSGKVRRQAINEVKAIRGTYMQSTMQSLSLSNIVNRVADQGTRLAYAAEQPLVRGLEKVISPVMQSKAMKGADSLALNTTKEARQAAKEASKGTLMREIVDNFKANVSGAGAGRNPVVKGIAKLDAISRATSSAITQLGDLSTQNVRKALLLGASRPEAAGLKTVEDYRKYFGEYMGSRKFQEDLGHVTAMNNPRIGLAGAKGDNMESGGKVSRFLSKYVDNGVRTGAEAAGIKPNRLITEANDYVKGNVTGYAGVGSRVMSTVMNAAAGGIPRIRAAVKMAKSGDPTAVAHATQVAAQSVADAVAAYGTAGAAVLLAKNSGGVVGFTGPQPKQGSSDSAYNKGHNVPPNQWYVNLPNGDRAYFDPARPFGAPGVAADIATGIATGKNAATTAGNALTQTFNQAGGSSLPKNVVNAQDVLNPSTPDADKAYASKQLQATAAPSTGFLNNIANFLDPITRAPGNFIEDIKSNIPMLRPSVPTSKDSFGNDIPNSKQASGGSGLFSLAKNPDGPKAAAADSLESEITRLQKIDGSVMPTNANTNATNPANKEFGKMLLNDSLYASADDKGKAALLHDVLIGKTTKDISNDLGSDDKQVLLEHAILGDKAKAWLDNNTNAANYYRAHYNNLDAKGTLTSDDQNLENKKGAKYKMLQAEVDQQIGADSALKQLYDDTDSTEWKNMTDPESDSYDPETAGKLLAYDDARTKAGVSGKSSASDKNKYVLKTGKGKGGRGGSGRQGVAAVDKFAFASLPDSLIGGVSGSSKDYATDAPTFQPIADLKAPNSAQIPVGRTISVKRGIQI